MIHNPSFSYKRRDYVLDTTFLISFPFEVSNPVAKTIPKQPLVGRLVRETSLKIFFDS